MHHHRDGLPGPRAGLFSVRVLGPPSPIPSRTYHRSNRWLIRGLPWNCAIEALYANGYWRRGWKSPLIEKTNT